MFEKKCVKNGVSEHKKTSSSSHSPSVKVQQVILQKGSWSSGRWLSTIRPCLSGNFFSAHKKTFSAEILFAPPGRCTSE